jgi:hypothetical protein
MSRHQPRPSAFSGLADEHTQNAALLGALARAATVK